MNKRNPFGWSGSPDAAALFEEAKRWRAEQEKMAAALQQQQEFMQSALARQIEVGLAGRPFLSPITADPRAAFNVPPQTEAASGFEASRAASTRAREAFEGARKQLADVQSRQERIAGAAITGRAAAGGDADAEAARLDLGRALNRAVETGLLTEERAVGMIVAGGINNAPLGPSDARSQVVAALAAAVAADALSRAEGNRIAAILDAAILDAVGPGAQGRSRPDAEVPGAPPGAPPDGPPDDPDRAALRELALASAPDSGATVSEADLARLVRSVPDLIEQLAALEDAVYAALTVRPCHRSDHGERHRDASTPCESQALGIAAELLGRLGSPPGVLPRVAHQAPDGRRAPCCAQDGNVGTWLVYGRTLSPSATFSGGRPTAADPPP